ncbi:cell division protein ZipA C-terminal FtsZ-binding domain-containing protein [Neisseria lisongii]|uniref:Cell division protein ZipA n=1 Tax=Neisseria lisongii TaxID=2912188 RepID=A0AAW5ATR3_9NEIS|nr:cell division protein ZipA C-terminal FtsZ-binding domain-containing protein [Neisseria lisongii]MCF7530380.1 cell division protein ZipA [Neisseria lisongii]
MIIIVLGLAVILAVIIYNMYQENQYRKNVNEQFGHSDKDALLESKTNHVRDSGEKGGTGLFIKKPKKSEAALRNLQEQDELFAAKQKQAAEKQAADSKPAATPAPQTAAVADQPVTIEELMQIDLPWFDCRFDYLAYVVPAQPQELHTLPRLSEHHRFQIIGCTTDDRFQVAEPIPGVYYQGFIMGVQAVSRNGLAAVEELEHFKHQVDAFAQSVNAQVRHTDLAQFTEVAQVLDAFCARVDQTIAIHLISPSGISGSELRTVAESAGFQLNADGTFHYPGSGSRPLFTLASSDNVQFSEALLASQAYRGFSMLFDIPHVPAGSKAFDHFIELAGVLSEQLNLDWVNDKQEKISAEWIKNAGEYIAARQEEMLKIDIKPGSPAARRLFS